MSNLQKVRLRSKVVFRHLDANEKELRREVCENGYTFAAADIFFNGLLNSGPRQVTHLYARFGDSGANDGFLSPPGGELRKTNRSTFVASSDGIRGGLWVPVLSAPRKDPSDSSLYVGNQATYFFRIPYNIPADQVDPDNFNVSTSYIYAIGLAVAQNASDRNQDTIITQAQAVGWDSGNPSDGEFTKFQILNGGQTAIDYSIQLTIEA